jgi:hypothetical protein
MDWHTTTGYVPITQSFLRPDAQVRFHDKNPGADMPHQAAHAAYADRQLKGLRFPATSCRDAR